jgi:hypothetical protein
VNALGIVLIVASVFVGYEAIQLLRGKQKATAAQSSGSSTSGATSGDTGSATAAITEAERITGINYPVGEVVAFLQKYENAGLSATIQNPEAVNGEHATGLFQMMPSTFRQYQLSGHGDINNLTDNAIAGLRYIQATYRSWTGLMAFVQGQHPYRGY